MERPRAARLVPPELANLEKFDLGPVNLSGGPGGGTGASTGSTLDGLTCSMGPFAGIGASPAPGGVSIQDGTKGVPLPLVPEFELEVPILVLCIFLYRPICD